jgi:hypothetical protein
MYRLWKQVNDRSIPVMYSVTVQNCYWFAVCCYAINGHTHIECFIKAFIWKKENEITRTELHFDMEYSGQHII